MKRNINMYIYHILLLECGMNLILCSCCVFVSTIDKNTLNLHDLEHVIGGVIRKRKLR